MLSKCANPVCFARFHTLRRGRLFKVELNAIRSGYGSSCLRTEYFWLCEDCARVMKVVWHDGAVDTHPLHLELTAGAGVGNDVTSSISRG